AWRKKGAAADERLSDPLDLQTLRGSQPMSAGGAPAARAEPVRPHLAGSTPAPGKTPPPRGPRGRPTPLPPQPRGCDALGIEAMREGPEAKPLPRIAFEDPDHDGGRPADPPRADTRS